MENQEINNEANDGCECSSCCGPSDSSITNKSNLGSIIRRVFFYTIIITALAIALVYILK